MAVPITKLVDVPIDILRGVLEWIPGQSVDACLLKQTCSQLKWLTIKYAGWASLKVNPNLPFNQKLKCIVDKLPPITPVVTNTLKVTSLKSGRLESFLFLCGETTEPPSLEEALTAVPGGHIQCFDHLSKSFRGDKLHQLYNQALIIAAEHGLLDMVQYLFSMGANHQEALHKAVANKHDAVIEFLRAFGSGSFLLTSYSSHQFQSWMRQSSAKSYPSAINQNGFFHFAQFTSHIISAHVFTMQSMPTTGRTDVSFERVIPDAACPREETSCHVMSISMDQKYVTSGFVTVCPKGDLHIRLDTSRADPKLPDPYLETAIFIVNFSMQWMTQ